MNGHKSRYLNHRMLEKVRGQLKVTSSEKMADLGFLIFKGNSVDYTKGQIFKKGFAGTTYLPVSNCEPSSRSRSAPKVALPAAHSNSAPTQRATSK